MYLWVLSLLVMAASLSYFVILHAAKQDGRFVRFIGYMVGGMGLTAIAFSTLYRVYKILIGRGC